MRTVKYSNRFKRDYRREKSGQIGKKLDGLLMEAVDMLAADMPCPVDILTTPCQGNGTTIAIATSGRI